jgi:Protein of unknown function (DUF3551)
MHLAGSIILAIAAIFAATASNAQTYDPRWPVCMKVYGGFRGGGEWVDCSYTSMPQCQATASGRAAMCVINPYGSLAEGPYRVAPRARRPAAYQ